VSAPRPVLVYDADCAFCTRSAQFARRWVDRRGRYAVRPWQQLDLAALGLTPEQCDQAAQFVTATGQVRAGHRAVATALTHGAPPWRPLGWLLQVPGVSWLAAGAYAWVAAHRHELPGGTAACRVDESSPSVPGDGRPAQEGPPLPRLRRDERPPAGRET
jgi:predicted DCC family thiol-disulfide oxidoreductase YuxK